MQNANGGWASRDLRTSEGFSPKLARNGHGFTMARRVHSQSAWRIALKTFAIVPSSLAVELHVSR